MTDLTAFGPHDPICPAPHASDVCMCPWIAKARADERARLGRLAGSATVTRNRDESLTVTFTPPLPEGADWVPVSRGVVDMFLTGYSEGLAEVRARTLAGLRARVNALQVEYDPRGTAYHALAVVLALIDGMPPPEPRDFDSGGVSR